MSFLLCGRVAWYFLLLLILQFFLLTKVSDAINILNTTTQIERGENPSVMKPSEKSCAHAYLVCLRESEPRAGSIGLDFSHLNSFCDQMKHRLTECFKKKLATNMTLEQCAELPKKDEDPEELDMLLRRAVRIQKFICHHKETMDNICFEHKMHHCVEKLPSWHRCSLSCYFETTQLTKTIRKATTTIKAPKRLQNETFKTASNDQSKKSENEEEKLATNIAATVSGVSTRTFIIILLFSTLLP